MTEFEKLVLRGLWLILRISLMGANRHSGSDEVLWAIKVADALDDQKLRNL